MTIEKAHDTIAYILGFKSVKTVRHRILVIISHVFLWGLFFAMPLLIYRVRIADSSFFYRELVSKSFLVILFYAHYYYLIPRFFKRRKIVNYLTTVFSSLLILCILQMTVEYFFRSHMFTGGRKFMVLNSNGPFRGVVTSDSQRFGKQRNDLVFAPPLPGPEELGVTRSAYYTPATLTDTFHGSIMEESHRFRPADSVIMKEGRVNRMSMSFVNQFGQKSIFWFGVPMVVMNALSSGIVFLLLSGFIRLANTFIISEKQKKVLENERLNAELNFLKLQINPHFLFNTLNSIYSQAHLKSEQTEYSILKFSQIMRYVLYESNIEKISLRKDLEYIRNYIDFQKLRISKNIQIGYDAPDSNSTLQIAPLLMITFIENAFKHGISYSTPSSIIIRIRVNDPELILEVSNTIINKTSEHLKTSGGGVGLLNAKRRLDVLYPERYNLQIVNDNNIYAVTLKIKLDHETELPDH